MYDVFKVDSIFVLLDSMILIWKTFFACTSKYNWSNEILHYLRCLWDMTNEIFCRPFIKMLGNKILLAIEVWSVIAPLVWSMCYNNYILINIAKTWSLSIAWSRYMWLVTRQLLCPFINNSAFRHQVWNTE